MNPRIPQHRADRLRAEINSGAKMSELARREGLPYQLLKDIKGERAYLADKKYIRQIHKTHSINERIQRNT